MGFTQFFIDYVPMYNKFRAITSILVIAEFTIPLLAILALCEIFRNPQLLREKIKYVYLSFGLTAGFALLFALAPRLIQGYIPAPEMAMLQRDLPAEHLVPFWTNLEAIRVSIFTADAWRSFFIILVGTAILLAYNSKRFKAGWAIAGIAVLCLVDLWTVDKRYLHDSQFIPERNTNTVFKKTAADEQILKDPSISYRVLPLSGDAFSENRTSYWHKNVAGYSAVKLQRYQDMIDYHISPEMRSISKSLGTPGFTMETVDPVAFPVLNMLNTKYFIAQTNQGPMALENPAAYGNAWFVDNIQYVNNANEEIAALGNINPMETAVVDVRFRNVLGGVMKANKDSLANIKLISYEPNRLVYETSSANDGIAVFSEVYYPRGWKINIDGQPVEMGRANYILRILNVPAGNHTIDMHFDPTSLKVTETIAYISLALLLLGALALGFFSWKKYRKAKAI